MKILSQQIRSPHPVSWIRFPGENVAYAQKNWIQILGEAKLKNTEDFFSVVGEPLSKPGLGKRYRARLSLARQNLFLKRYNGDSLTGLLMRWYEDGRRTTQAEREANVAITLMEQGVGACVPVAYGHSKDWGTSQKSFLVTAAVPGVSLETFVRDKKKLLRKEKLDVINAVASLARKFHENGWRHRDFYLCHIFISDSEGEIKLTLIDLARAFRPRWRAKRWSIKDLAQLNYSAPTEVFSRTDRLRFARKYFRCEKLNAMHKSVLEKISKKTASIARHDRKRP